MRRRVFFCFLLFALCALLFAPSEAEAGQFGALAFRIVGTVVGSYFGGPFGGMIGGMIGGALGGLIFGQEGQTVKGPRLSDRSVQSAAYGSHIHRTWGTDRVPAQLIFSSGLKRKAHKTEEGKGMGGGTTFVTYTYSVDMMLSFGRKAKGIKRLWADTKLIYDVSGTADIKKKWAKLGKRFTVRDGNESQLPSALEESYHGAGQCSAHRGLFCIEFEDFQLANFANRIPNFTAEIFTEGEAGFTKMASYTPPAAPYSWWVASWGYIDPNGEIWAMYYPFGTMWPYPGYAHNFHWTLDKPSDPVEEPHVFWEGEITQEASIAFYIRVRSDEHSSAAFGTNGQNVALSYFRLEEGNRVDILGSEVGSYGNPEILVKYGEEIYVVFATGHPAGYLIKFNLAGIKLAESSVIVDTLASSGVSDLGRSESYLWALFGPRLLRIDPDTLALDADIPITGTVNTVLAMTVVSDDEVRVVTAGTDGTRFHIVNTNTGVATLDKYDPSNTYAGVRAFGKWGMRYVNGIYVVDFGGYIGGFAARIDFFADTVASEDILLWKIVRDINLMSGLDSVVDTVPPTVGDIEVSELTDMVHGYTLTRTMTGRDALTQLAACYFFDCREKDLKLDYPKRGKASVKSLPGADLAARGSITETLPDRLTQTRTRESELPLRVHVIFNNWEAAYQPGHEYAPRLITDARATMTAEIAVAITSAEARQIADTHLAMAWLQRESFTVKASRKHMLIDAADNVEVVITEE